MSKTYDCSYFHGLSFKVAEKEIKRRWRNDTLADWLMEVAPDYVAHLRDDPPFPLMGTLISDLKDHYAGKTNET